ncbi:MAG: DedA family protein [Chlamydiales bacterium]|nr:DedA family protein [Chlamydiales bacterium]
MQGLIEFVTQNAHLAHWFIFGAIVLAGMNIPISADLMIIIAAILSATVVPEHTLLLFLSVFLGCYFSAWVAYWIGRKFGPALLRWRLFRKILDENKIEKIRVFYDKHGLLTLLIGRFIPFGIRNGIFMSAGISRMPFSKFIIRDSLACFIWTGCTFTLFYLLGQNYEMLYRYVKAFNVLIFLIFSVTVIAVVWYKRKKKITHSSESV